HLGGVTPLYEVNESPIEANVVPQISAMSSRIGMPSSTLTITMSRGVRRRTRRPRRPGSVGGAGAFAVLVDNDTVGSAAGGVDRLGLCVDVVQQPVDVAGLVDELLERRDRHGGGEGRVGVPVEELGDLLRGADELRRLLLDGVVDALVVRLV